MKSSGRSLTHSIALGTAWTIGLRMFERSVGIVSTVILARLLSPRDFGIVAMAMAVVALLERLTVMGVESSLISHPDPTRAHYDTAWTLNFALGLAIGIVLACAAVPAAGFYREPEITSVLLVVALFPVLTGASNIGVVEFRRNLQFDRDFLLGAIGKFVGFIVTIIMAFALRNYWALVFGMLMGRAAEFVAGYFMHPYRPRLSVIHLGEQFAFSRWMLVNSLLTFLRTRLADLILGKQLGPAALGMFNMGREIGTVPTSELVMPINRAIFPGYAKIASDPSRLADGYFRVLGVTAFWTVPAAVGVGLLSESIVQVLLGARWLPAVPVLSLMAIFGLCMALQTNSGAVFLAMRRPDRGVIVQSATVIILVPLLILWSSHSGIAGAAMAFAASGFGSMLASYWVVAMDLKVSWSRYLRPLWRPIVAATVMGVALREAQSLIERSLEQPHTVASLLLSITLGVVVYLFVSIGTWILAGKPTGAETDMLVLLRSGMAKWRRA